MENILMLARAGHELGIDVDKDLKFAGLLLGVLAAQTPADVWRKAVDYTTLRYLKP
jgi:hypothetical protein